MTQQEFKIPAQALQNVLNYLVQRPYIEVAQLISEIQTATPIEENGNDAKE